MTDCPVCGRVFEEEEDLTSHKERDHPAFTETYATEGAKDWWESQSDVAQEQILLASGVDPRHKGLSWLNLGQENQALIKEEYYEAREAFAKEEEDEDKPVEGDEIEQQQDKPVQSHDDWKKELEGLKDDFATEQEKCAICNGEHTTNEHPVTETDEDDQRDMANDLNKPYDLVPKLPEPWEYGGADYKREGDPDGDKAEEEGGADDPLKKVDSLSESYRFMSRDKRSALFESLDFTQRDSAILSGLEWNELTRPIKVEASEAYAKEEDVPVETETGEDEEEEENKAYENLYNLEKYHSSPDFKKKSLTCNRCNESFYNINDRAVHFNEVHATEQEYELPDQCPFCKEIIQEPDTLDWHMQEEHDAHVPSTFTQTGVSAGMADTDFDALENGANWIDPQEKAKAEHKKWKEAGNKPISDYDFDLEITEAFDTDWACPRCGNKNVKTKYDENGLPVGRECPKCGLGQESYASEGQGGTYGRSDFMLNPQHEDITTCVICGRDIDSHSNPNTDYRGMRGDAPPTDHYFLGGDTGGSDDKYDFESYAKEDGMYANFGDKPKENSWSVLTVASDLIYFNSEQEAKDYVSNFPEGTYQINPPRAGESRASDLRKEIKKKEQFINMASFENPLNMADDQAQLEDLRAELESLGGEELELTEGEGGHQDLEDTTQYTDDPEEKAEEDTSDYEVDVDEYLKTGEPVQKLPSDKRTFDAEQDEDGWGDPEDTAKDIYDLGHPEKAEEDDYVDDSDNAGEKYICPDCDEEFNSDTALQEHQYSYYHGDYKDDSDGETSPRNVMGGY